MLPVVISCSKDKVCACPIPLFTPSDPSCSIFYLVLLVSGLRAQIVAQRACIALREFIDDSSFLSRAWFESKNMRTASDPLPVLARAGAQYQKKTREPGRHTSAWWSRCFAIMIFIPFPVLTHAGAQHQVHGGEDAATVGATGGCSSRRAHN
jgi:hypothetical protein